MSRSCVLLSALLLAAAAASPSFAQDDADRAVSASPMRIIEHDAAVIASRARQSSRAGVADSGDMTVAMRAMGQQFILDLEPNHKVLANLPRRQRERITAEVQLYRGKIANVPESWVRLSRRDGRFTGMIFDGVEVIVLDDSETLGAALEGGRLRHADYTVAYRLADMEMKDAMCAMAPEAGSVTDLKALTRHLAELTPAEAAGATRQIDVAVVADRQFSSANGANSQAAVAARMNVVDGIFSSQVGVQLNVTEIRVLATDSGLTSTSASTLLGQFQSYTTAPSFRNPGLAHLFTGRNLDGSTAGIAYIGVLCSARVGIGLSQIRGTGTAGALIVAHELGHNFGAPHDNQGGSACAGTPGNFLMNPSINGSDEFSACSRTQMADDINRAACVTAIPDVTEADVRVNLSASTFSAEVGESVTLGVEVDNIGDATAAGAELSVSVPAGVRVVRASTAGRACTVSAQTASCDLRTIAARDDAAATVVLEGTRAGQFTARVTASADNDANSANNSANATLRIVAPPPPSGDELVFEADFDSKLQSFKPVESIFESTDNMFYESAFRTRTNGLGGGGALHMFTGGRDNADILNMSVGYNRTFSLASASNATVTLTYRLRMRRNYEYDEYGDFIVAIDDRRLGSSGRIDRVRGDGNGGEIIDTGWKTITLGLGRLSAGSHKLTLGVLNNKKTNKDEFLDLRVDNVSVSTAR